MASTGQGAAHYTPINLALYDAVVFGFNMKYIWKCSAENHQTPLFNRYFSKNHLDIGVGSGYFPAGALRQEAAQARDSTQQQRITLMDLNTNSLEAAKIRIEAQAPAALVSCVHADATVQPPPSVTEQRFDSISTMNLLHCIPGPATRKVAVLRHCAKLLAPDGVLFGCTILGYQARGSAAAGLEQNWLYHLHMRYLNWQNVFDNAEDTADVFDEGLRREFQDVETWIVGSMLLFRASRPFQS